MSVSLQSKRPSASTTRSVVIITPGMEAARANVSYENTYKMTPDKPFPVQRAQNIIQVSLPIFTGYACLTVSVYCQHDPGFSLLGSGIPQWKNACLVLVRKGVGQFRISDIFSFSSSSFPGLANYYFF